MKIKGFTLIELLIVISIIGILTTLIAVNLTDLQKRGRDSQRKTSLETIRTALEKYYDDNDTYPATSEVTLNTLGQSLTSTDGNVTYLNEIPVDPKNSGTYIYKYCVITPSGSSTIRTSYRIYANLENNNDKSRYCGGSTSFTASCQNTGFTCTNGTSLTDYDYGVREP